jgi:HEAT repeat protein
MLNAAILMCALLQADDAAVKEALERFKTSMKGATPAAQASAIQELSRTPHESTFKQIAPFLMGGAKEARAAAGRGLGNFADYKKLATPALMNALNAGPNARDYDVQAAIYEGLGKLADPTSADTVHKGFRHEQVKVAKAALACAGSMRLKESMEPLIELLKDIDKWIAKKQAGPYRDEKGSPGDESAGKARLDDIQKAVIKAVQDITKEKWTTTKEWQIWWDKHKATFEPPK